MSNNAIEPHEPIRFAARGAVGFGVAGLVCFGIPAAVEALTGQRWLLYALTTVIGWVLSGVIGGATLAWGRAIPKATLFGAIGFGLGFLLPGFLVPFSLISLQAGGESAFWGYVSWGAVAWGIGFGLAGMIGASFLRAGLKHVPFRSLSYLVTTGGGSFGIGGAIGGATAFAVFFTALRSLDLAVFGGLLIAHIFGGAGIGLALGRLEIKRGVEREELRAETGPAPRNDGYAVAAAALGALGAAVALVYPARFRLPSGIEFASTASGIAGPAAMLLAVFGLPPLLLGLASLWKIQRSRGELSGKAWASAGAACGAILASISALLLWVEPVSTRFEVNHALAFLESVRGQESDWNYGNVVHKANIALGRIALKEGRIQEAARHLIEAGKTPGSPQLNSFGPDLTLAKALLQTGERNAVIEYLRLCARFWETTRPHLEQWMSTIAAGGTPDFDRSAPLPAPSRKPSGLAVLEAWRSEEIRAYGAEGTAPRRAEPGRAWLALLVEVGTPSESSLRFGEIAVVDEAGASRSAVAIAGAAPGGMAPKFLFFEDAFGAWREDPLPPLTASTWSYTYEAGQRSGISHMESDRRLVFGVTRDGQVKFFSGAPARLFLLFAPPADRKRFELRFGEHARVVVRDTAGASPARAAPSGEEWEERVAGLTRACDAGDLAACYRLGLIYKVGWWKVPKDGARAAALFQKACDGGHRDGCGELGMIHRLGKEVPKDDVRAAALLQKACDGGDAWSCSNLGMMHEEGSGAPKDLGRAVALYKKACDGRDASGCTRLGYRHARGETVRRDEALAVELYGKGCDGGDPWGCAYLGEAYFNGRGVRRDKTRAIPLLKEGCNGGAEWACRILRAG